MTVTYTAEVATCRMFGCFYQLLRRWRGSVYKLVWMDLLTFLFLYYMILFLYTFGLSHDQKRTFEYVVEYCGGHGSLIPISFVLGFYVLLIVKRWWDQYMYIPWPDSIAVFVSAHVKGNSERSRVIRRTVMRYVTLCLAIALVSMSSRAKKRFPTWEHFVTAGLLQESEKQIIKKLDQKFPAYPKQWMPIVWSASIIARARKEGMIRDDCGLTTIVNELNSFRGACGNLMHYDFISVPLVYTQVVTLAVYSYFVVSLIGRQPIEIGGRKDQTYMQGYFPLFTTLEFCFYVGWLKVAETMINPFGEDDDDFEVNWLIDRHLLISYLIVDEMHQEHPELVRDQYWDEVFPSELPYANEKDAKREGPPESSTAKIGNMILPASTSEQMLKRASSKSQFQLNVNSNRGTSENLLSFTSINAEPINKEVSGGSSDDFDKLKAERAGQRMQRMTRRHSGSPATNRSIDTIFHLPPRPITGLRESEISSDTVTEPKEEETTAGASEDSTTIQSEDDTIYLDAFDSLQDSVNQKNDPKKSN